MDKVRYMSQSNLFDADGTLEDLISKLKSISASIDKTVYVRVESEYESNYVNWDFTYFSPETEAERDVRLAQEKQRQVYQEKAERLQLEALKKKFGE